MTTPTLSEIYHSMEYGPETDDTSLGKAWLAKHNNVLGDFINNENVYGDQKFEIVNPATTETLAVLHKSSLDTDYANGESLLKACKEWSALSCHVRARHLYSIARHVQKNAGLLASVGILDGVSGRRMKNFVVPQLIRHFYYYAGWAKIIDMDIQDLKPIGKVLLMDISFSSMPSFALKIGPALATGNTVFIGANRMMLFYLLFAEICAEAGLPPGIINVVNNLCNPIPPAVIHITLERRHYLQMIHGQISAANEKVKSHNLLSTAAIDEERANLTSIVYESADVDSAVEGIVESIWSHGSVYAGTDSSAGSVLFVQQTMYEEVIRKVKIRMQNLFLKICVNTVRREFYNDESVNLHLEAIKKAVDFAKNIGAEVYQSETTTDDKWRPTLVTRMEITSGLNFDEICWPIVVAVPFRTSKEAINLCNNTIQKFNASVYTEKLPLAIETAKALKASTVWINCSKMYDAAAGTGDFLEFRHGRSIGSEVLYEFMQPKWQSELVTNPSMLQYDPETFGLDYLPDDSSTEVKFETNPKNIDTTFKLYYGGAQKRPDSGYYRILRDAEGGRIAEVPQANKKDVINAVEAAGKAQSSWEKRSSFNRSQILYYLAENLDQRMKEMTALLAEHANIDDAAAKEEVQGAIERLFYWAAFADKYGGGVLETPMQGVVLELQEAVGTIGIVCPEEAPLLAFVSLLAPAVARGNTIVIVPSGKCPTPALKFYQLLETSDVPGGVVNILTGSNNHLARQFIAHNDLNSVWYFGTSEGVEFCHCYGKIPKRYWTNAQKRDWLNCKQGQGYEFLHNSTRSKTIWMPMGETFAN